MNHAMQIIELNPALHKDWGSLIPAIVQAVTQAAHEQALPPALLGHSQRQVALEITTELARQAGFKYRARTLIPALGARLRAEFAVRSFQVVCKPGLNTHQLILSGFC